MTLDSYLAKKEEKMVQIRKVNERTTA